MIQNSIRPIAQPTFQPQSLTDLEQLKAKMLAAQTLTELHALIVNYTDQEMKQAYNRLTPEQQSQIDAICEKDRKV